MPAELAIPLALFLVFLNGFFVAAEFSLVKVRNTRVVQLAEEGKSGATMTLHALGHLDAYLSATQLGITLASIGLGWIGEPAVAAVLDPWFLSFGFSESVSQIVGFAIAFTLISVAHIVLGELAPKSWAIQMPDKVALRVSYPLHWFYVLFKPAIVVLNGSANWLLKRVGIEPASEHDMAHSQEELSMLLTASGESGVLKESEVDIVKHVFQFGDKDAADIMVPRMDVLMIHKEWPLEQAVDFALANPYSRYPLTEGDADSIQGMVHIKDLLRLGRDGGDIESIRRDILMVPPSRSLDDLLRDFQRSRKHMALVMDEYGGTSGLVTLEDVLEQIVGSIDDETDVHVLGIAKVAEGVWDVLGKLRLDEVNEVLHTKFESENYDSIGGYITELLDRQPQVGDQVESDGWRFKVEEMSSQRLVRVRLAKLG